MSALVRRIIYVCSYEAVAILTLSLALMVLGYGGQGSTVVAVASSAVAILWNFVWTSLFEAWERRQPSRIRTVRRRIVHAIGFEGGLVVFLVPLLAWILSVSLREAFILELGILVFFFVYTFAFAWLFDIVLPPATRDTGTSAA